MHYSRKRVIRKRLSVKVRVMFRVKDKIMVSFWLGLWLGLGLTKNDGRLLSKK